MIRLAAVVRGMLQRGGTTVMILAVALVATAAAAAGPIYYQAARTSILRDTVAGAGSAAAATRPTRPARSPACSASWRPRSAASWTMAWAAWPAGGCSPRPSRRSRPP